jgi:hypothetical protein
MWAFARFRLHDVPDLFQAFLDRLNIVVQELDVIQAASILQAVAWCGGGTHQSIRRLLNRAIVLCPALPVSCVVPMAQAIGKLRLHELLDVFLDHVAQAGVWMRMSLMQVARLATELLQLDTEPSKTGPLLCKLLSRFEGEEDALLAEHRLLRDYLWIQWTIPTGDSTLSHTLERLCRAERLMTAPMPTLALIAWYVAFTGSSPPGALEAVCNQILSRPDVQLCAGMASRVLWSLAKQGYRDERLMAPRLAAPVASACC